MSAVNRRYLLRSGSLLAISSLLPAWVRAGFIPFDDIPRSSYGFATTCDQVAAGYDLTGKTVLITGCNSGMGYESLRTLAEHGAHVIGTARTLAKAEEACASVNPDGKLRTTPLACELTDMASVKACANAAGELDAPLDILLCNAGIMALPKLAQVQVDGVTLEQQFVVNHLGHYLLTRLLLPRLDAAQAARVVMVSSVGYTLAPPGGIQFDNLSGGEGYRPFTAYGQSKLANILMSGELSRRYADSGLTANAIHPGMVATNLGRYITGKPRDPDEPLREGMKTPEQGAATQVYVAIDRRLAGVSGYYFEDCNPAKLKGEYASNAELARQLWDVSDELVSRWL